MNIQVGYILKHIQTGKLLKVHAVRKEKVYCHFLSLGDYDKHFETKGQHFNWAFGKDVTVQFNDGINQVFYCFEFKKKRLERSFVIHPIGTLLYGPK